MNEEQNINDGLKMEDDGGEQPTVDSQQSTETEPQSQSQPKPQPMEVHHHPHVEKKSFKEYLLEGLMIFLAVTMGFIAENIREHFVEKETEKRNIELIVDNLKEDTASLERSAKWSIKEVALIDSLLLFRDKNLKDTNTFKIFWSLHDRVTNVSLFHSNNSGFEQMKSTGTIRFITKKQVLDSLYKYENRNQPIKFNQDNNNDWILNKAEALGISFLVFDVKHPKPFNIEQKADALNQFYNCFTYAQINLSGLNIGQLKRQKQRAANLIKLLQTEYHLKKE